MKRHTRPHFVSPQSEAWRDHPAETIEGESLKQGTMALLAIAIAGSCANRIEVGIGPSGGYATRWTTNFGAPQVEAPVGCRRAVNERIPQMADGGFKRDGSMTAALLFGPDSVMLVSAFARKEETQGETVLRPVLEPESEETVKVPFTVRSPDRRILRW